MMKGTLIARAVEPDQLKPFLFDLVTLYGVFTITFVQSFLPMLADEFAEKLRHRTVAAFPDLFHDVVAGRLRK